MGLIRCDDILVPVDISDPTDALSHFNTEFARRYGTALGGTTHPVFYMGSLEEAVQEALHGPAKDVSKPRQPISLTGHADI